MDTMNLFMQKGRHQRIPPLHGRNRSAKIWRRMALAQRSVLRLFSANMAGGAAAVGNSADGTVAYTISDDGMTLTFSGSGKIGTDVIADLWKNADLKTIANVVIGEGITEISRL